MLDAYAGCSCKRSRRLCESCNLEPRWFTILICIFTPHCTNIFVSRSDDVRQHLEIDAHIGGVNDLAFSHFNKQLCVITCGDDKTIKIGEKFFRVDWQVGIKFKK